MPTSVMMVELNPSGHRLVYLSILAKEALRRGLFVTLALSREALKDHRSDLHLRGILPEVNVVVIESDCSLSRLQRLAMDACCDLLIIPDGLRFGKRLLFGRRFKAPLIRILIMDDPRWWLEGARGLMVRKRFTVLFLAFSDVRSSQELFWLRHQGHGQISRRAVIDPLIIETGLNEVRRAGEDLRRKIGLADGTFWFGCVGALDRRKNIDMVLEALQLVQQDSSSSVGLALIGPWAGSDASDEIARQVKLSGMKCIVEDRHLTNFEMNASVAALDCVVLAYSTVAPNSTLVKAAALGVRSVVAGSSSFKRFAFDVSGRAGVDLNAQSLANEMQECMVMPPPPPRPMLGPDAFTAPLLSAVGVK